MMRPIVRACLVTALAAIVGPATARGSLPIAGQCAQLTSLSLDRFKILSAIEVPAGTFAAPGGQRFEVPASCRVSGFARPTGDSRIGFELWLPQRWSGRYVQLGNGGFAGNIDQASLATEIASGAAAAMTDTGHKADQFDASWALGHPEKLVDYGYRSIKATADASKSLIRAYYGRAARRRYFVGCSNGGRHALMAAQRYPDDWDGIIAGSPALYWTKQLATFAAIQHRLSARSENWIPVGKLPAIQRAAVAACPPLPGLSCRLDVSKLRCPGRDRPDCLTRAQARSLELIQSGPRNARGAPLFYGFEPSGAALPDNWERWILNADANAPSQLTFATQAYRYLILNRPNWQIGDYDDARDFTRASDVRIAGRSLSTILDADSPDLTRFARHGGKLIMYVGGADALISPAAGLAYYRLVTARMGGLVRTQRFFRLFVAPGMQHCQGGGGPNAFGQAWIAPAAKRDARHDIRRALQAWVEHGRVPRVLVAAKYDEGRRGALIATQELRPFPGAATSIDRH